MSEILDPEREAAVGLKFLGAVYDSAAEHQSRHPGSTNKTSHGVVAAEVGERTGFTPHETERLRSKLVGEGKIQAGPGCRGIPNFNLTSIGVDTVERWRYDTSSLARWRRSRTWIASAIGERSKSALFGLIGAIGAYLSGVLSADRGWSLWRWIARMAGLD